MYHENPVNTENPTFMTNFHFKGHMECYLQLLHTLEIS